MPYIPRGDREIAATGPVNVGELTFAIQQMLKKFLEHRPPRFQTYAECLGALRAAELDLWDRRLQAHETAKRAENGDVW